jgi:hypothetical protein
MPDGFLESSSEGSQTDMDGPDLLAARLLRALVADDLDAVSHLVIEIEDSGYSGLVAAGLA